MRTGMRGTATESVRIALARCARRAWRGALALAALGALVVGATAMSGTAGAHVQSVGDSQQGGSMAYPGGNIRAVHVAHNQSLLAFYVDSYTPRGGNSRVTPLVYLDTSPGGGPEYALWRFGTTGVVYNLRRGQVAARALFSELSQHRVRYVLRWRPFPFAWRVENRYSEPGGQRLVLDRAPDQGFEVHRP